LARLRQVLAEELNGGAEGLKEWIAAVRLHPRCNKLIEQQTILSTLTLTEASGTGEDTPSQELEALLVSLREKAIVINVFLKPDRYSFLINLASSIQRHESDKVSGSTSAANDDPHSRKEEGALSNASASGSNTSLQSQNSRQSARGNFGLRIFKREAKPATHNGGPSTAPSSTSNSRHGSFSSKANQHADAPVASLVSPHATKVKSKLRSVSAPPGPAQAVLHQNELNLSSSSLGLDSLLDHVSQGPPLPSLELVREAFDLSALIVKNYLIEELPAKYQAAY
jgi:hypothetical protein